MFFDTHITSVLKRAFDLHRNGRGITLSRQKPTGNDHNPLGKGGVPQGAKPHAIEKGNATVRTQLSGQNYSFAQPWRPVRPLTLPSAPQPWVRAQ